MASKKEYSDGDVAGAFLIGVFVVLIFSGDRDTVKSDKPITPRLEIITTSQGSDTTYIYQKH